MCTYKGAGIDWGGGVGARAPLKRAHMTFAKTLS